MALGTGWRDRESTGTERLPVPTLALITLLLVSGTLIAAYLASEATRGEAPVIIDLDAEANVPTWWSSAQLLGCGLLTALIAMRNRALPTIGGGLAALAVVFVAMSADEVAGFHETFGGLLDRYTVARSQTAFVHTGVWFAVLGIPFALALLALGRCLAGFLGEVEGTVTGLTMGFAVFLAGALGIEAASNFVVGESGRPVIVAVEEGLELIGVALLLSTMLRFVIRHPSTRPLVEALRSRA